ncbi:MAG TPA: glycine zipper domain-containing protein [Chthoniobacterales bacterium]
MMRFKFFPSVLLCAAVTLTGCETAGPGERSGTALGALAGAGLGAILGNNVHGLGSGEGAVAGALIGGLVGNRMGAQKDEINDLRGQAHTINVNVRNSDGSYVPVLIRQIGPSSWQGPRGEIYNSFPTQAQLARRYAV